MSSCTSPVTAYQPYYADKITGKRPVIFTEKSQLTHKKLKLPCGGCDACMKARTSAWSLRIMQEAQLYENNMFLTLTINDKNLPRNGSLSKTYYKNFMKRFRKEFPNAKIRYVQIGEYGKNTLRPHHHAALFNFKFPDEELYSDVKGTKLYTSKILDKLWSYGECKIGELTQASANYIASYIFEKKTGKQSAEYSTLDTTTGEIKPLQPPFITMSNKPGIGSEWYDKFATDIYPHDYCVNKLGNKQPVPKYYDKKLEQSDPEFYNQLKEKRVQRAKLKPELTLLRQKQLAQFNSLQLKRNKRDQF